MKKSFITLVAIAAVAVCASQAYAGDVDGDGVEDGLDNCPYAANGNCGVDSSYCDVDGDTVLTILEFEAGSQADWNDNGIGDACEDYDFDGYMDYLDNCPGVANSNQDELACDDQDGDGVYTLEDNCPDMYNPSQNDYDEDGFGNNCDNCRLIANADQADSDDDGFGDACTEDEDGDGVSDMNDNCPLVPNADQLDSDHDGRGDACEPVAAASESPEEEEEISPFAGIDNSSCSLNVASAGGAANSMYLLVMAAMAILGIRTRFGG